MAEQTNPEQDYGPRFVPDVEVASANELRSFALVAVITSVLALIAAVAGYGVSSWLIADNVGPIDALPPGLAVEGMVSVLPAEQIPEEATEAAADAPEPAKVAPKSADVAVPQTVDLLGAWDGNAGSKPCTMNVVSQTGGAIVARIRVGKANVVAKGTLSGASVKLSEGKRSFSGTVTDEVIQGTYTIGGRSDEWLVIRK